MTPPGGVPFSIGEEMTSGRLSIEASAGTGKTFTLAAVAVRCIAESEVSASQLLVVTFTRAATSELRSRVRGRLVEAESFLNQESPPASEDELLQHLARTDRPARLERIRRAIREFDSATITTIHGFAGQILSSLGSTSGTDPDAVLQNDEEDLCASACTDVLAAAAAAGMAAADLPTLRALTLATRTAGSAADLHLVPDPGDRSAGPGDRLMTSLVEQALSDMAQRRRRAGTRSFGDLLADLRTALEGPGGAAAVQAIRNRYKVALIDEFQDTDSLQWDIFNLLFGREGSDTSLILVGDPKQAIYAFRGANVHTYLQAMARAPHLTRRSLEVNWRSDGAVVDSLRVLLDGATFGDEGIAFTPTHVAPAHGARRMRGSDGRPLPALSLRLALGPGIERGERRPYDVRVDSGRRAAYRDMVAGIRELLDGARIPEGPEGPPERPVTPSDVAVLVRTRREASAAQAELLAQGIPAVLARGESVLESPAADQWRWLLSALSRPSDPGRARACALTWFGGWSADHVAHASEEELSALQATMQGWGETLVRHGVTPFVRQVWEDSGVVARVLRLPDGDRAMTDLQHVGELLQAAAPSVRSSLAGLLSAIDAPPQGDADTEGDGDTTARRIESEAKAVQIMTVWVAKGLEFPIVCCPTLWCAPGATEVIYQDPITGRRTFDVTKGKAWPDRSGAAERRRWSDEEALGERLRLLYVALTRARHHTMVWWSRGPRSDTTALARILFARADGVIDPDLFHAAKVPLPPDAGAVAALAPLVARGEGTITAAVHGDSPRPANRWVDPESSAAAPALERARLGRSPDRTRRRWSFTAMTRAVEVPSFDPYDITLADGGAGDETADDETVDDETVGDEGGGVGPEAGGAGVSRTTVVPPMALLPAGTEFGTLVHGILERTDFSSADVDAELHREIDRSQQRLRLDPTPTWGGTPGASSGADLLAAGLSEVLHTPLGAQMGGLRLRDLAPGDRINEMSFELHLGAAGHRPTLRDVGRLLVDHLPPDDPFAHWARGLADGTIDLELAGHLTGSIDLVFRVPGPGGRSRFVVADYKTNRLSDRGRPPRPGDYGQERMARAMAEHHYPLQALLYSVALHRYARWRVTGYDPALHLGGAAYLFVRGMRGTGVDRTDVRPDGVFCWDIPPRLVELVSQLLDGQAPESVVA